MVGQLWIQQIGKQFCGFGPQPCEDFCFIIQSPHLSTDLIRIYMTNWDLRFTTTGSPTDNKRCSWASQVGERSCWNLLFPHIISFTERKMEQERELQILHFIDISCETSSFNLQGTSNYVGASHLWNPCPSLKHPCSSRCGTCYKEVGVMSIGFPAAEKIRSGLSTTRDNEAEHSPFVHAWKPIRGSVHFLVFFSVLQNRGSPCGPLWAVLSAGLMIRLLAVAEGDTLCWFQGQSGMWQMGGRQAVCTLGVVMMNAAISLCSDDCIYIYTGSY